MVKIEQGMEIIGKASPIRLRGQPQVSEARGRNSYRAPRMDGRDRALDEFGGARSSAQIIDYCIGDGVHGQRYAINANKPQDVFCDDRNCDGRKGARRRAMDAEDIKAELDRRNMSQRDLAEAIGLDEIKLSKSLSGIRRFTVSEMDAIRLELAPENEDGRRLEVRSIPVLGSVPAGSFQPREQRGGKRLLVSDPEVPSRAYGLEVTGDSMDLIVPDGGTVIIDPDDKALWPGSRYVIRTADGETTFKEYQDNPARLIPCSSNPAHREIALGSEPIVIEGRVFSYTVRDIRRRTT